MEQTGANESQSAMKCECMVYVRMSTSISVHVWVQMHIEHLEHLETSETAKQT